MTEDPHQTTFTPPSRRTLLLSTAGALAVAAILLLVAVLPAEYGIDPTGIGRTLGIKGMSVAQDTPAAPAALPQVVHDATDEALAAAPWNDSEFAPPPPIQQFAHTHDAAPSRDTIRITLEEGEEVEYKAMLATGEPMLFSWSIPEGDIYYDFHGEPTQGGFPQDYFLSYGEGEARGQRGSFVAPFAGHHGWYWLNYNAEPVTIELTIEGYYSSHAELYRARNF
jgi:hypothetical protein